MGGTGAHANLWALMLNEEQLAPLAAGTVACYLVGFVMYGLVFKNAFSRALCVDKGVKTPEGVVYRYNFVVCVLGSVVSAAIKSGAILGLVALLQAQGDSLCMYMQAACVVFVIMFAGIHARLWQHRPMAMIVLGYTSELISLNVAAYVMFAITH